MIVRSVPGTAIRKRLWIAPLAFLLLSSGIRGDPVSIPNPNFDAGVSGWSVIIDTAVPWWDGTTGSPNVGSARSTLEEYATLGGLLSCHETAPGESWTAWSRVRAEIEAPWDDYCQVGVLFFSCGSCNCSALSGDLTAVLSTDGWDTAQAAATAPASATHAGIALLTRRETSNATSSLCRFDSVRAYRDYVYAQDLEIFPPDWSVTQPAECAGSCGGTAPSGCQCGSECTDGSDTGTSDCCLDACTTCGHCP